jgi:hypothetical protein
VFALAPALIGAVVALHVSDRTDLPVDQALQIVSGLKRALEQRAGAPVALDDPSWWGCPAGDDCPDEKVIQDVRGRTAADEVVLLALYAGPSKIRINASRVAASNGHRVAKAQINLPMDRSAWRDAFFELASSLYLQSIGPGLTASASVAPAKEQRTALPWILLGGSVVAAGGAIPLGLMSRSERSTAETIGISNADYQDHGSKAVAFGAVSYGLAGVAVLAGAWGLWLLVSE